MIQTLSVDLLDQKKTQTLQAQALRKTVSFRDVKLIDEKTILFQGVHIGITDQAFRSLLGIIGMSKKFSQKFETLFTAAAKSEFINRMKDAMASNISGLGNITMVLNPINRSVVLFQKEDVSQISNERFLDIAEGVIGDHNMGITNWSIDPTTGIVTLDAYNPKAEFEIKGLKDEVFTGGVTFRNSPLKGFEVMPYLNRQFCTNGLTTSLARESYQLHSLNNGEMEKFFQNMQDLRRNNFAPTGFSDRVRIANSTPASLSEMERAYNWIKPFAGERADNWIPLEENLNQYAKIGFDDMNAAQKKMSKTNQSVWSVIQGITHFASHAQDLIETNMQDENAHRIQINAGMLIGKEAFDHENSVPNPFDRAPLGQMGALLS